MAQVVQVRIPPALRHRVGQRTYVAVTGHTVRDVVSALESTYPGMGFHLIYETGELRPFVNIFVGQENIRYLNGLETHVPPGAVIHIMHAVAGG